MKPVTFAFIPMGRYNSLKCLTIPEMAYNYIDFVEVHLISRALGRWPVEGTAARPKSIGGNMQNLFSSRRFWMVILDTVLSTISFIVAGYVADPKTAELIKFGVVTLQPIFVIIIGAYTFDDVAGLRANGKYPNA